MPFDVFAGRQHAGDFQPLGHGLVGGAAQIVHEARRGEPVVGQEIHHHHGQARARGNEDDIAAGLDELEAEVARGTLERGHGAFGKTAAHGKFARDRGGSRQRRRE